MSKKGFAPIIIVLIIALLAAGGVTSYIFIKNKQTNIIGGDTDSHGCLIAAGYSWCEVKQKCLRTWEEPCEETTTTISTTTTTTVPTTITTIITKMFQCGDLVTFTYKGSTVTYGTVSSLDKCWLDRNLGASQVATAHNDSLAYGDLFQWGRLDDGHQKRDSGITFELSDSDDPGHSNFILVDSNPYNWEDPQNDNLWQGVSGINNPCPSGWRIPTEAEWDLERANWSEQNPGGAFMSPLKLTVAGYRTFSSDSPYESPQHVSSSGGYWSSTVSDVYASSLYFDLTAAFFSDDSNSYISFLGNAAISNENYRALGFSVRCIKD